MRTFWSIFITLLFTIPLFTSCTKDYFAAPKVSESDTQSFKNDIQPIFNEDCLGSGCHVSAGGVTPILEPDLSYLYLTTGNYVDTLHPEQSELYLKITASTNYMPPTGKLSSTETEQILIWIKQGAKNN